MVKLPPDGYLRLPLRFKNGRLETCTLEESIRRFLQLNLNVPQQGKDRPAWMPADSGIGCRVPHYDFQTVVHTLGGNTARLVSAIKQTAEIEPRLKSVSVKVSDLLKGDRARRRPDGSSFKGVMKRVLIECHRVDDTTQTMDYEVALGGSGPVFEEDS